METSVEEDKPFFIWHNPTRMHIYTHLRPERRHLATPYSSEFDIYGSGMMELDMQVGELLDKLDELGIAENTIVIFTTDNGPMTDWYPDAGASPYRGEKATTWEGGVRVPLIIRWPAKIPAGKKSNGIQDHTDLFTTLAAAAGVTDLAEKLDDSHHVYIDGVNNLNHWIGDEPSAGMTGEAMSIFSKTGFMAWGFTDPIGSCLENLECWAGFRLILGRRAGSPAGLSGLAPTTCFSITHKIPNVQS